MVVLLDLNRVLNEHCLSLTNRQADRKIESDFKAVSVNILSLLIRWLSQTFITGRVYHQQHFQCFDKKITVLPSTWISSEIQLGLWGGGAVHRFCGSIMSWWKGKGPELALKRHGSGIEMCVWDLNHSVQSQASVYDLQSRRLCLTFN